jgi:DNA polymerase III delta prime subunit
MSVKNLLLWEKYRPKKIEDIILPQRILNHFDNGVNRNYIFYGHYGTGKTSLARILIGKYSKDKAFLEINSSLYTSIDTLRSDVEKFCKTQPMIESTDGYKYVFLDEFERVSSQYQDALKAFIEQYHKNVRFILTTNHFNKISEGIKSRFTCLNFDSADISEEKYLKQNLYKKLTSDIIVNEQIDISKENLVSLINKKFPDLRSIFVELQNFKDSKDYLVTDSNVSNKLKLELYSLIYDKSFDYEQIYHFLMSNFGPEKIDLLFKILGKDFIDWSLQNKKNVDKLFEANFIISELHFKLESNTDPIILGMTLIGKFRQLLIEN